MVSKRYVKTQVGFSLLEILISLLILSVGLLGLGGLQLSSLKSTNNAHYRTVASLATTDLIDRMRVNPLAVVNNEYTRTLTIAHCSTPLAKVCESGNECDAAELAAYDLYRVNCGISTGGHQTGGVQYDLPQAELSVNCAVPPCTAGMEHRISIRWQETDDDDEDDAVQDRSYSMRFIP